MIAEDAQDYHVDGGLRCLALNETNGYEYFPDRCMRGRFHRGWHRAAGWYGDQVTIWWDELCTPKEPRK